MSVKTLPHAQLMPPARTPRTVITAPVNKASCPAMDNTTSGAQEWSVKVSFCCVTFWGGMNENLLSPHVGHWSQAREMIPTPSQAQAAQLFIAHITMGRGLVILMWKVS